VKEVSRLTGASSAEAFQSEQDLDRLAEEFMQLGFGDEMELRDAIVAN
jgi:hypothetical protein